MSSEKRNPPVVVLGQSQLQWHEGTTITLPEVALGAGESLGVMGPSGCGKSTWLKWLVGVPQPHVSISGSVNIAGKDVANLPIEGRSIGLVMQEQALFPHYSVAENLAFAVAQQKLSRAAKQQLIVDQLKEIGLQDYGQRMPDQLSGGERARVALLRAVLARPKLVLLDEPFNGLDEARRVQICQWTYSFLRQHDIAAIIVSHDASDLTAATYRLPWPLATTAEEQHD